jgi:hypothetical protein
VLMADFQPYYQIKVSGHIREPWLEWFGRLQHHSGRDCDGQAVTTLTGPVIDQAELRGILQSLWDLNLEILSVTRIAESVAKNNKRENHL